MNEIKNAIWNSTEDVAWVETCNVTDDVTRNAFRKITWIPIWIFTRNATDNSIKNAIYQAMKDE